MPEDLLLELDTAAPVAGSLENIEDLLRVIVRQANWAAEGMEGSALTFDNAWHRIIAEVARGHTAEMQAVRPRLLEAFEKRLGLLQQTHALLTWLHKRGRADLPDADILSSEIAGMERLKTTVFDLWRSADDLEDLAARDYPLTTADLDQLGLQRRPPASYYAEESKPF